MGCLSRGIAKLQINWGGFQILLELPIDLDVVNRSDRVVTMDMPLPVWGENQNYQKQTTVTLYGC
jgi:hypothetical protein